MKYAVAAVVAVGISCIQAGDAAQLREEQEKTTVEKKTLRNDVDALLRAAQVKATLSSSGRQAGAWPTQGDTSPQPGSALSSLRDMASSSA